VVLLLFFAATSFSFAQTKVSSQPEDSLLFREGEILLSKGDAERALWRFKKLTTDYPHSSLLNEAKVRMGICYTQLKRPKDGIRILNELLSTSLAPARMMQVFSLMGDNYLELKDPLNALFWYGKGLLLEGQPQDELKAKVRSVVDNVDTEEMLARIETLYRGAYAGGYATLRSAQLAKRRGDTALHKKTIEELQKEYQGMDYVVQAREPLGPQPAPEKPKYTIGVVLPLSGAHRSFGNQVLQAIQLALREATPAAKTPLIALAIRDSKGNSKEAERAVEELAAKEKVIAVIGPLLSLTVDPVARKAQQLKIPLITLSQKESAYGKGEFVFQNSLTPLGQVQALGAFAAKDMEYRSFATFYPNSPYGLHYKNLFSQEVTRRGGKVLGSVAYQEEQTDFSQEIKTFFKIKTTQEYDSRKKKTEEFKAGLTVDALFVPDTYDRAGLILSQMAYFDVTGSAFLGTNAWNDPRLISIAGASLEGIFFVDCFFRGDNSPIVAEFVEEFRKAYQREPNTLEAIAYDGARLLRSLLQAKLPSSPPQLREEISRVKDFQGVSGLKGFAENGKALRQLSILTVKNGQIEQARP
jgi:branched-chain amino acid transport system substrate-binding protein